MSNRWKQDLLADKVPRDLKEADLIHIPETMHKYAREIIALRKEVKSLRKTVREARKECTCYARSFLFD